MRTTITIDDDLYRDVEDELGVDPSTGASATVRAAFEHIAAERRRRTVIASFDIIGASLEKPDALDGAWR